MSDPWLVDGPVGSVMLISAPAYTLKPTDNNLILVFTLDTDVTVTVPAGILPRGWTATVIQFGAGVVSLTAQASLTLYNVFDQFTTAGRYAVLTLDAVRLDQVVVSGITPGATGSTPYAYSQPTTGATVTATARETRRILDPAGTLATLTVVLPPSPRDGDIYELMTSKQITALTINGESFLLNSNSGASWVYRASNTTWYARY